MAERECRLAFEASKELLEEKCGEELTGECKTALKASTSLIGEKCRVLPASEEVVLPEEVKELRAQYGNPLTAEEIKEMMNRSPWLRGYTDAMCRISGVTTEPELSKCKMAWARKALT